MLVRCAHARSHISNQGGADGGVTANGRIPKKSRTKLPTLVEWSDLRHNSEIGGNTGHDRKTIQAIVNCPVRLPADKEGQPDRQRSNQTAILTYVIALVLWRRRSGQRWKPS